MIKQLFPYKDIDNLPTSRTVMFNLTQFEVEGEMELEVIQDRFQKFKDEVIGNDPNAPLRQMTGPEKREILGMIKVLIKHSYGIRDGKRFKKSQEIWDEFEQTGAFSAFLYWLFEKPERANAFMAGIWPQGLDRPEDQPSPDLKVVTDEEDVVEGEVVQTPDIDSLDTLEIEGVKENPEKAWYDYTREEMDSLTDDEFDALVERSSQGKNVPAQLLVIRQQRKYRGVTE